MKTKSMQTMSEPGNPLLRLLRNLAAIPLDVGAPGQSNRRCQSNSLQNLFKTLDINCLNNNQPLSQSSPVKVGQTNLRLRTLAPSCPSQPRRRRMRYFRSGREQISPTVPGRNRAKSKPVKVSPTAALGQNARQIYAMDLQ
jgi:hypothetical protein